MRLTSELAGRGRVMNFWKRLCWLTLPVVMLVLAGCATRPAIDSEAERLHARVWVDCKGELVEDNVIYACHIRARLESLSESRGARPLPRSPDPGTIVAAHK